MNQQGGSPVSVQKLTFCVSKVSGQDDQGSGEAPAKEDGSPNSGEFIVRKISLEHQQNWDAEFPSVDPKQDQQMHASRARSTKGIARLEEHQPEEGEHGRNEDLPGKKLVADLLSKIIAVKPNRVQPPRRTTSGRRTPSGRTRPGDFLMGQLPSHRWSVRISGEKGGWSGQRISRASRIPA